MSFAGDHGGGTYLRAYLSHLDDLLARDDVCDIFVNRPGEVWVETIGGGTTLVAVPALDARTLERLARAIAGRSAQGINRASPLLAATLPDGERVQVIAPPATRDGIAIAIRKQAIRDMTLDDCHAAGVFDAVLTGPDAERRTADAALDALLKTGDIRGFLIAAVRGRRNIVVSGGTSTGKTTFLNALLQQVPADERLIVIEDTPEVRIVHANAIGLIAGSGGAGGTGVTVDSLLQASLRMRPSRIILGELRGAEAYSFLRAVNTGHPGSITTLHADSPARAAEQLALMVLQSGTTLSRGDILSYVESTVDIFVQLSRIGGKRVVSAIRFNGAS